MFQYLVTSKARRLLLVLLWGEQESGSVAELAALAGVSFASAHAELKAMLRHRLVRTTRPRGKGKGKGTEVYAANQDHPAAELLAKLVTTDLSPNVFVDGGDLVLKQKLAGLGAPLRGVKPTRIYPSDLLAVLVDATRLARRDAVVARSVPICFWRYRDALDARSIDALDLVPEEKHALAFFLDLTGELGDDDRLGWLADNLRDQRLTQVRPFFAGAEPAASRAHDLDLATKWGFRMTMDLDSFRQLFDKFTSK